MTSLTRFRRVPEFAWEAEQNRAEGALQMFAALFITTPADARAACAPGGDPEDLLEWATSMRHEIERGGFRPAFLKLLSEGFTMNSHPGFGLSMMKAPRLPHAQFEALDAFEAACQALAAGEADPPRIEDYLPDCHPETARECRLLRAIAVCENLSAGGKDDES